MDSDHKYTQGSKFYNKYSSRYSENKCSRCKSGKMWTTRWESAALLGGKEFRCVLGTALWSRAALLDGREWDCWAGEGWKTVVALLSNLGWAAGWEKGDCRLGERQTMVALIVGIEVNCQVGEGCAAGWTTGLQGRDLTKRFCQLDDSSVAVLLVGRQESGATMWEICYNK